MAQNINVDVTPNLFQPTLYYHQGDIGRAFTITISTKDGYTIPSGATVKIEATKPSGLGFSVSGTLSGNVVSFVSTEGMTDEYGRFPAQLKITSGNDILYTANFLMVGAINTHPASVTDGTAEQVISEITLLVERAETAASIAATDAANAAQARVDEMMDYLPSEVADLKSAIIENESLYLDGLYKIYPLNGYLNYAGRITNDGETSYATSVIPCSEGDKFHYSGAFGGNAVACIFLNGSTVVDFVTKNTYSQTEIDITVPSGVNAIRFGGYHTVQEIYKYGALFDITRNVGLSPLDGSKKWYAFGDSFTHGDFTGYVDSEGHSGTESDAYDPNFSGGMYKTWAYWIAKRHKMRLSNLAVNGAKTTYMTTDNLYASVPSDCDYVTFMLGLNDTSSSGDIDSTDPTTWHGAWNVVLNWMRLYRPKTKLGIIIPPSWLGNSWRVEIEAVAKRHGIPVLNLYSDPKAPALLGNLSGTLLAKKDMDSAISIRVTSNNVVKTTDPINEHPNLACFEQMSHIIEEFMQGL